MKGDSRSVDYSSFRDFRGGWPPHLDSDIVMHISQVRKDTMEQGELKNGQCVHAALSWPT